MAKEFIKMVLVGPNAGRTMEIMGVQFKDGVAQLPHKGAEGLVNALGNFWNAWEEGTEEHEKAVLEFQDAKALKAATKGDEATRPMSPLEKLSAALGLNVKDATNGQLQAIAKEKFKADLKGNRAELVKGLTELVEKASNGKKE